MQRIFLSHSSLDARQAVALKQWLVEQDPPLANEIFLDIDHESGLRPGERWKDRLTQASTTCEAVVCLLSSNWEASHECKAEYRVAETLSKQILCARLEPSAGDDLTAEWQRCDLFGDGPTTSVELSGGPPMEFATDGLFRLRDAIRGTGIGARSFVWPPPKDPDRTPYRGWEPLEQVDAAVFFGRDAAIVRALDKLRGMRLAATESLFVVLGPSGAGKSSFLRAGVLPRLAREDRRFALLGIVRPGRYALTGDTGLAAAVWEARTRLGMATPSLGEIKAACTGDLASLRELLVEIQQAAVARLPDGDDQADKPEPPTLILPLDQAEELFSADAGEEAVRLLSLIKSLSAAAPGPAIDLITLATIRTDRYEVMQAHPELSGVHTRIYDDLKPLPPNQFKEVITGPALRASEAGHPLTVAPQLVERLLNEAAQGADTLPMLSLTLARLYADYGSTGELTVERYEAMGGMRHIVKTEIDQVVAADPDRRRDQLDCLRAAFIPWLATINPDNDQPMRRVAHYDDLPEKSRPLIDALVAKRLMVKDQRDGHVVVEVALESLLRQWDDLAEWLREQRHELIVADDVERAGAAWRSNDENPAWLLSGTRLADAEKVVSSATFTQRLSTTRAYLDASRRAENERHHAEEEHREAELRNAQERQATAEAYSSNLRRRSRVLRMVLAVTAVIAVAAVVALGFAIQSRGQAKARFRQVTSERLASEALSMLANTAKGSDARAVQQLLAANALSSESLDDEMYTAVAKEFSTIKLIETGDRVFGTALSPDGRRMVTGGAKGTLRMWDAQTGGELPVAFQSNVGLIDDVRFSPDGRRLVSGGDDQTVRLWDADTGREIGPPMTGHSSEVWSVAFSPDGHRLASGAKDNTVRLWDADSGRPIGGPLTGHTGPVQLVTFSPDGRRVASVSDDSTVRLWDTETGTQIGHPFAAEGDFVYAVAFSPDGRRIASAGRGRVVRMWDADTGQDLGTPLTGDESSIQALSFSPDGRRIATGDAAGVVRLWDAENFRPLGAGITGHQSSVWRVIFSPGGDRLISSAEDGLVRIWNLGGGQPLTGHSGAVSGVAFSPDGHRIASAGRDRTMRLWDAMTGRPIGNPITFDEPLSGVAFSPDGLRLATAGLDGMLRLWSADDEKPLGGPIDTGLGSLSSVAFSPDGRRVATGGERVARVWDAETREPAGPPMQHDSAVQVVAFSADGGRLATGTDFNVLTLWDARTGKLLVHASNDDAYWLEALAFSSAGKVLATAGSEGTIRLRQADTLETIGDPWQGHQDTITAIAFSPDGRRIVSASRDKGLRVWLVESGHQIGEPLTGHTSDVTSVAWDPRGERIVSGSADGTLRLWPAMASPNDLCEKLTANMSHKQWNEWVSPQIGYVAVCAHLPIPPD